MRIRKHCVAFLLLLSALPHHLADDSSSFIPNKEKDDSGVHLNPHEQAQQQKESEEESIDVIKADHDMPPTNQTTLIFLEHKNDEKIDQEETEQQHKYLLIEKAEMQVEQQEVEPLARPQQQDTGEVQQDDEDRLASSLDYGNTQFEEKIRIPEDCSSSLATDDSVDEEVVAIDTDTDIDIDTDNDTDNDNDTDTDTDTDTDIKSTESEHDAGERKEDLPEEIANQGVHEDGFRLQALSKIDTIEEDYLDIEDTNDETMQHIDDSSQPESESIKTDDDDDLPAEEESQLEELSNNADNNDSTHEIIYDHGHTHIDISKTTKDLVLEEVAIDGDFLLEAVATEGDGLLEEMVIERGALHPLGSIGTTNTDEPEVDDEEIIVLKDAKLAIGTRTESIYEEEHDDGVDADMINRSKLVIDDELIEENDKEGSQAQNDSGDSSTAIPDGEGITESSLENAAEEIFDDEMDEKSVTESVEVIDDNSILDDQDADVGYSREEGNIDSNTSVGQQIFDVGGLESEIEEGENEEDENEVKKMKDDDDEDDEDLADRVSVDYASKSAGALIIEKTAEFKGTSNLITGDRDKYAIVPCSEEKKHFVLSLSEDILVKEIKLANYERFSSTVKDFQVKGSHTLGKWVDLGTYKAESGNGEQTFVLENPGWARYLKFKFLTYHGVEWYCTLSQIKVHGSNMVQDFHEHWESIEEENNEEQLEADQSDDQPETFDADESENTDAVLNAKETKEEADADKNLFNSSVAHQDDPEVSAEVGDLDGIDKGDAGPRHAQITPSVHSKPKPLDKFRNHLTFAEIIQGEIADEELFSDLYHLIPRTVDNLPAHAKNNLMCKAEDPELRSVHQIGKVAIDSFYWFGSRIVNELMVTGPDSSTIASPKMNGFSNEYYQKRFGTGVSSMVNLYVNSIADPSSESHFISSVSTITNGSSSAGTEETTSSSQQPNDTHKVTQGEASLTGGKSSASPTKREEPRAQAMTKPSLEETNDSLDFAIQKLLKNLPSAECLVNLDFAEFKNKISATRKSTSASSNSQGGRMMEPIFKKLTDEIFALQTSLSVHDQFGKLSVGCYQRVILDLALEMEKLRLDQDERLRWLEEQILEPASMRMFQKLIVSLMSTMGTWLVSNGSNLFVTIKDIWIPKLLRYYLSKDTYGGLYGTFQSTLYYWSYASNAFHIALDYSSQAIEILATALESNGWDKRATYREYLSAWSAYYDGGMTVVGIVLILLFCRIIMMCSWMLRRNKKNTTSSRSRPDRSKRNEYSLQKSRTTSSRIEGLHAPPSTSSKKQKKKSNKDKRRSRNLTSVPAVEDTISMKASTDSIPELEDEIFNKKLSITKKIVPLNGRGDRTTANRPSVVSLEEE